MRGSSSGYAPGSGLGEALTRGAVRHGLGKVAWVDAKTKSAHSVAMTAGAQAAFGSASGRIPWQPRLEKVTEAVRRLGPRLEVAAVRTVDPQPDDWTLLTSTPPEPPGGMVFTTDLRLARRYVLDAYGIQVLTSAHIARARDLSAWGLTPLGNDRHLVHHPDPEAWFANDTPNPDVLAQARHDFGDLILTHDTYLALRAADQEQRGRVTPPPATG